MKARDLASSDSRAVRSGWKGYTIKHRNKLSRKVCLARDTIDTEALLQDMGKAFRRNKKGTKVSPSRHRKRQQKPNKRNFVPKEEKEDKHKSKKNGARRASQKNRRRANFIKCGRKTPLELGCHCSE